MKILKRVLFILGALFLLPMVTVSLLLIYWDLRHPPSFAADPVLQLASWTVIPPGKNRATWHNANTDLVYFNDAYFLVHAQSKWHLEDKKGRLLIHRSEDLQTWETVAHVSLPATDVRDPKFAVINGRLFLYFLPNYEFDPLPKTTCWTVSDNGVTWSKPQEVEKAGWNFWRPKTADGETWYVMAAGYKPAYDHRITILLKSTDGLHWEEVSEVYTAHPTGEPAMEFLPDGRIIATLRCSNLGTPGYEFGNPTANTVIATAAAPYQEWSYAHSFITRLDGATLFPLEGRVFAVGRNHLGPRLDLGNHLTTKRTAFYEVKPDRLVFLFNLPSNGDTAYTGVVRAGDYIYTSYYTSPVDKDYPWIAGICFLPRTEVRLARVSAAGLLAYADSVGAGQ